jgi:capsular exopolysaccharide synthesis family protein
VLAQGGKKTVLVDCNLRKPTQHKIFGLKNTEGLASILSGERSLREACIETLPGLSVVTAGLLPTDPAQVLGTQRFARFLATAREGFDYVLLDSPPLQVVSDGIVLAAQADSTLLVMDPRATRRAQLQQAVRSLEDAGVVILGIIMNNVEVSHRGNDYGVASYTYG